MVQNLSQSPARPHRLAVTTRWVSGRTRTTLFAFCRSRWLFSILWLGLAVVNAASAGAQESDSLGETRFPDVLSENTLPLSAELYLLDDDGTPIYVPNEVSMEDLLRIQDQISGRGQANAQSYHFQSIEINATVHDHYADLEGNFQVTLQRDAKSAVVPIRFGTCQVGSTPPEYARSDADYQFDAEPDGSGYRWNILPPVDAESGLDHRIAVRGKSRVLKESDRHALQIALPTHPCSIRVVLPAGVVDERVRDEDVILREVTQQGVELTILSRGGDFSLSWRPRKAISQVSSVEARSETSYEIVDSPGHVWKAKTTIDMQWYGSDPASEFRIRLPAGSRRVYFDSSANLYVSMTAAEREPTQDIVDGGKRNGTDRASPVLVIENSDPEKTPKATLTISWEWQPWIEEDDGSLAVKTSIPGPMIDGISLHRGKIDCAYPASYSIVFEERESAEIQLSRPGQTIGSKKLQFTFSQQQFEMGVTFRREQSLPTVRPTYHVRVDRNKLEMILWLECSFDVDQQRLELGLVLGNDWILQENTARSLASPDTPYSDAGNVLRVQLQGEDDQRYLISGTDPDPTSTVANRRVDQVWRLVAESSWTNDDSQLNFQVPKIVRGRAGGLQQEDHGAGALIVSGDDNILLQKTGNGIGLLVDSFSTEYEQYVPFATNRKPLAYRFQSGGRTPTWDGTAQLLPQALSVRERVAIEVLANEAAVEQEFNIQVSNDPLTDLRVAVAPSQAATVPPQFYVDSQLVSATLVGKIEERELFPSTDAVDLPNREAVVPQEITWNVYQLLGAPEMLGAVRVSVKTRASWEPVRGIESEATESGQLVAIPLARPLFPDAAVREKRTLELSSNLDVELVEAAGASSTSSIAWTDQSRPLRLDDRAVRIRVHSALRDEVSVVQIERSWLQSAITSRERRDRYVMNIRTTSSNLSITLPEGANAQAIIIDGIEATWRRELRSNRLVVTMPANGVGLTHTLEVFYSLRSSLGSFNRITSSVPQISGADHLGRFYWQLTIPGTQHLAWSPDELVPEFLLRWGGMWWYRESSLDEPDLIEMLDATEDIQELPVSANQYLFSGRLPNGSYRAWVVSRVVLWFPIGVLAIAITTLVINVPIVCTPTNGFLLAGLIGSLALLLPDVGILVGQTAVISLGLALLIFITQAAIESRVRRRSVFTTRPATNVDGSDHFSLARSVPVAPAQERVGSSVVANDGG